MKKNRILTAFITLPTILMIGNASEVFAADVTDSEQLGDYTHYNGIIFDYFESRQADIEGALAIGGKSEIGTSGQFDIGAAAKPGHSYVAIGRYDNPNGYPSLLLNGIPTVGNNTKNNIHVYGGSVVLNEDLKEEYLKQSNQISGITKFATNKIVDEFFEGAYDTAINTANVLVRSQQNENASISISEFTGWAITPKFKNNLTDFIPDNLNIGSAGISANDVLVVNITDSGHVTINSPQITSEFGDYELIIFNFPNATSVDFTGGSVHVDGTQINTSAPSFWLPEENALLAKYSEKIIWNFPIAESIQIYANGIVGSILAPDAYVEGHGGSINGMLIADSFVMINGHELHGFRMTNKVFDFTNNHEEELLGSVKLYKIDADQNELYLEGAQFKLEVLIYDNWESYSSETDSLTTDRFGHIIVENLPEGRYRFVEIAPPDGYELPTGGDIYHEFTIDASSGVETAVVIIAKNTKTTEPTIDIPIKKVDESTREGLQNAHFYLYRSENEQYTLINDAIMTDENGQFTIQGLTEGVYYLFEVNPPEGYKVNESHAIIEIIVTSGEDGLQVQYRLMDDTIPNFGENGILEIPNSQADESRVVLTKVGDDGESLLSGARFNLYVYVDGEWTLYEYSDFNFETDEYGQIKIEGLPNGRYKLVEVEAPDGYEIIGDNEFEFTIQDGNLTHEKIIINHAIRGSLTIRKIDSMTEDVLSGAEFTLYRMINDNTMEKVAVLVTGEDGMASIGNLEQGTYWLEETRAPEGYRLPDSADFKFIIGADGETIVYDHKIDIENEAITGSVKLTKVDGGNHETTLPNVEFELYMLDGANHEWIKQPGTFITDEYGKLEITGLNFGTYKLVEINNPNEGYKVTDEQIIFSISSDGMHHITITLENFQQQSLDLQVYKVDEDDHSIHLAGAKFSLYHSKTGNEEDYAFHTNVISNDEGLIIFPTLKAGYYRLIEVKAPDGYILENKQFEFEVRETEDGLKVYYDGIEITPDIQDQLVITNKRIGFESDGGDSVIPDGEESETPEIEEDLGGEDSETPEVEDGLDDEDLETPEAEGDSGDEDTETPEEEDSNTPKEADDLNVERNSSTPLTGDLAGTARLFVLLILSGTMMSVLVLCNRKSFNRK